MVLSLKFNQDFQTVQLGLTLRSVDKDNIDKGQNVQRS